MEERGRAGDFLGSEGRKRRGELWPEGVGFAR